MPNHNPYSREGEIVAIPLFLTDLPKAKPKKEDHNKQFAFARAICEKAGKVLIEVFKKTGSLDTPMKVIVNSGILMKPFYTVWTPVIRKRWLSMPIYKLKKELLKNYNFLIRKNKYLCTNSMTPLARPCSSCLSSQELVALL